MADDKAKSAEIDETKVAEPTPVVEAVAPAPLPAPPPPPPPPPPPAQMTAEQIGAHAKSLVEDPMFLEVMDRLERRYTQSFRQSLPGDTAAREAAYAALKALEDIKTQLGSFAIAPRVEGFNRALRAKHK
jgi:hypothetical protein